MYYLSTFISITSTKGKRKEKKKERKVTTAYIITTLNECQSPRCDGGQGGDGLSCGDGQPRRRARCARLLRTAPPGLGRRRRRARATARGSCAIAPSRNTLRHPGFLHALGRGLVLCERFPLRSVAPVSPALLVLSSADTYGLITPVIPLWQCLPVAQ